MIVRRLWLGSLPGLAKTALTVGLAYLLFLTVHGLLASPSDPAAIEEYKLCAAHGWKPFRAPSSSSSWLSSSNRDNNSRRKVYDLFMVNTELDWLEIHLNTTWDAVDYFVLVESRQTFTGLDKPLVLRENLSKFDSYRSKIIYHEIEYPPNWNPPRTWDREDLQRNAMFTQVFPRLEGDRAPTYGDVIVVADVDEIPRPETLDVLRSCRFPRRLTLLSHFYYYSFQYRHRGSDDWPHPQATYYQGTSRTVHPNDLRMGLGFPITSWWDSRSLRGAAWHCSSCFGTMDELLNKMQSFSHRWMNAAEYRDRARLADRVSRGKDIWDRPSEVYDRVDNNTDVPRFLLENPARFPYTLSRDGPTAGFADYTTG